MNTAVATCCPTTTAAPTTAPPSVTARAVFHFLRLGGPSGPRKIGQALELSTVTVIGALFNLSEHGMAKSVSTTYDDLWAAVAE